MNKILRAYSINKLTSDGDCKHITICDFLSKIVKNLLYPEHYPIFVDEKTNMIVDVIGRVPADSAKAFLSNCILVDGLPTKEIVEEEDIVQIKLNSIISYCDNAMNLLSEGDILIIEEYNIESLIEFVVKKNTEK